MITTENISNPAYYLSLEPAMGNYLLKREDVIIFVEKIEFAIYML